MPADAPARPAPRWSVERRLDFIAARLAWEGRINRGDLVSRFGVSPNQATADLKRFEDLNPGALVYDTRSKTYRAGQGASAPDAPAATSLLRELRLIAEGVQPTEDGLLAYPPPVEVAEPPARSGSPEVLAVVLAAVRERRAMSADYLSFTSPERRRRVLEPHAMVFDGFRWHARAHDPQEGRFRDFVLGRMGSPTLEGRAQARGEADADWATRVQLVIGPHPGLSPHQRQAIESDYGMSDGRLVLAPRVAVAWYVRRRLGLTEGHAARPARDQHLVLLSERAV